MKITKLKDVEFNGNHPNGINEGYEIEGKYNFTSPVIGDRYWLGSLFTSTVTEIIHNNDKECKFRTKNSIYLITK